MDCFIFHTFQLTGRLHGNLSCSWGKVWLRFSGGLLHSSLCRSVGESSNGPFGNWTMLCVKHGLIFGRLWHCRYLSNRSLCIFALETCRRNGGIWYWLCNIPMFLNRQTDSYDSLLLNTCTGQWLYWKQFASAWLWCYPYCNSSCLDNKVMFTSYSVHIKAATYMCTGLKAMPVPQPHPFNDIGGEVFVVMVCIHTCKVDE